MNNSLPPHNAEPESGRSGSSDNPLGSSAQAAQGMQPDDLHDLFATAASGTDDVDPLAAIRNDPNYAALIRDLEYIASQARLLFAPADEAPSDAVWTKIENELKHKQTDA